MKPPFSTYLSHSALDYCPGGEPATFWLAIQNNSAAYASFQFHLQAAGETESSLPTWYRLVEADAYTIPPNDCVKFAVEILRLPPHREGFVGVLCLQASVSSPELSASASQTLKLYVTGVPPQLLPQSESIKTSPDSFVEIPVSLKNPNDQPISLELRLAGLPTDWVTQAHRNLMLHPNAIERSTFRCTVPPISNAHQGQYPFSVEVWQSETMTASQTATLEVLPAGAVDVSCELPHQEIPAQPGRWLNRHRKPATYTLNWRNRSNNSIHGSISIQAKSASRGWLQQQLQQTKILAIEHVPDGLNLAIASHHASQVNIEYRPPWFGWGSHQEFQIQAYEFEPSVELVQTHPTLSLKLRPVIPRWLQGCGILGLIVSSWLLLSQGHQATVNHVEFPHQTDQIRDENPPKNFRNIVSGAENGTLLAWPLRHHLGWLISQHVNPLNPSDRTAIEVVRYSPNNQQVAVGYTNGDIDLYDWKSKEKLGSLKVDPYQPCEKGHQIYDGDRVFDLTFSVDGTHLYSTHGSGRVLKWQLTDNVSPECLQPSQENPLFAATLTQHHGKQWLAVAGQFNRLRLIDLDLPLTHKQLLPPLTRKNSRGHPVYLAGKDDYITSLASPQNRRSLLAIGDTQGKITLLDLETCTDDVSNCMVKPSWIGHDGTPIRAVAFTADGCYLISAGDDGNLKLWQLKSVSEDTLEAATIRPELVPGDGFLVRTSRQRVSWHPFRPRPLETVDVVRLNGQKPIGELSDRTSQDTLRIASGGEDRQVRLQTVSISRLNQHFNSGACPAQ